MLEYPGLIKLETDEQVEKAKTRLRTVESALASRLLKWTDSGYYVHRGLAQSLYIDLFETVKADLTFYGSLYPFQSRAVTRLAQAGSGYLVAPTGSGKTIIGLALAAQLKQRTIFIVPSKVIADQVVHKAEKFLRVKAGIRYGGRLQNLLSPFIVTTVQKVLRQEVVQGFGCVVVDECHHIPATAFIQSLEKVTARYCFGLTATLHRRDNFPFKLLISPTVYEIPIQEVEAYLSLPVVHFVKTGSAVTQDDFCEDKCSQFGFCDLDPRKCRFFSRGFYSYTINVLTEDEERNELVKRTIDKMSREHNSVLVLTQRIRHAERLAEEREWRVAHGKRRWKEVVADFKRDGGVLIATESLLGEGFDFPECECLILVMPAAGKNKVKQRVGRIMRKKMMRPRVIDFVDDGWLKYFFFARKSIYGSMGLQIDWIKRSEIYG